MKAKSLFQEYRYPKLISYALNKVPGFCPDWLNIPNSRLERQWWRAHAWKLRKFKNIHTGHDCFIIGNGPSLARMELEELHKYYSFGMNKIYLYDKCDLGLSYYVAINDLVIEQSINQILSLQCPTFISYMHGYTKLGEHNHINYIHSHSTYGFERDITKPLPRGSTVTFAAMQIAFYMGFRRIFLIGVDHRFAYEGKANNEQIMNKPDANHFSPKYFQGMKWHTPDLEGSELAYLHARKVFQDSGRIIYDCTQGGALQVFPKIDFFDALEIASAKDKANKYYINA